MLPVDLWNVDLASVCTTYHVHM